MKYLLYFLLPIFTAIGGYWYGLKIGSEQLYFNTKAARAISIVSDLRRKDELPKDIENDLEAELNSIIIESGRFLEEGHKWHPLFNGIMEGTHGLMKMAVEFRVENPRIIDGVEYSPFRDDSEEYFSSEEYLSGLEDLPPAERERLTKDTLRNHREKVARYKAAIEFYKNYERAK